jgi:hypothetical protein
MLQRKTPLVRVSEVARVSKLLESSQKPVTPKAIAEFFSQAGPFDMNYLASSRLSFQIEQNKKHESVLGLFPLGNKFS